MNQLAPKEEEEEEEQTDQRKGHTLTEEKDKETVYALGSVDLSGRHSLNGSLSATFNDVSTW